MAQTDLAQLDTAIQHIILMAQLAPNMAIQPIIQMDHQQLDMGIQFMGRMARHAPSTAILHIAINNKQPTDHNLWVVLSG